LEAKVLIERWRIEYHTTRPHSSLGYRPPAPESFPTTTEPLGGTNHRGRSRACRPPISGVRLSTRSASIVVAERVTSLKVIRDRGLRRDPRAPSRS
jgi:hypothetical protein